MRPFGRLSMGRRAVRAILVGFMFSVCLALVGAEVGSFLGAQERRAPEEAVLGGAESGVVSGGDSGGNLSGAESGATGSLGAGRPNSGGNPEGASVSFWEILQAGGLIGLCILALSIAGLALVIEHAWTIRRSVLLPSAVGEEVRALLGAGNLRGVAERLQEEGSVLGQVLRAGVNEVDLGWPAAEKAMEEALAEHSARLYRKIEYLAVIGNLAPMLGLLGTVIGMILAFRRVAETQGAARAADLAQGIYLALVTTVEGLLVAIPALAAFAFFRNRVDQLIAEVGGAAERALGPLKRHLMMASSQSPGAATPPRVVAGAPKAGRNPS